MGKKTLAFILATSAVLLSGASASSAKTKLREKIQEQAKDLSQGWYGGKDKSSSGGGKGGGSIIDYTYGEVKDSEQWKDWSWDDKWKKHFDWKKCGLPEKEEEEEEEEPEVPEVPEVPEIPEAPSGNQTNGTHSCYWSYNKTCKKFEWKCERIVPDIPDGSGGGSGNQTNCTCTCNCTNGTNGNDTDIPDDGSGGGDNETVVNCTTYKVCRVRDQSKSCYDDW